MKIGSQWLQWYLILWYVSPTWKWEASIPRTSTWNTWCDLSRNAETSTSSKLLTLEMFVQPSTTGILIILLMEELLHQFFCRRYLQGALHPQVVIPDFWTITSRYINPYPIDFPIPYRELMALSNRPNQGTVPCKSTAILLWCHTCG